MSEILDQRGAIADAEQAGFDVVHGNSTTLLLDLDTKADEDWYDTIFPEVSTHFHMVEEERWRSKSGGLHVVLHSDKKLSITKRLLLQACLGSDRKKEMLCLARVVRLKTEEPVLLFRPTSKVATKKRLLPISRSIGMRYTPDDEVY